MKPPPNVHLLQLPLKSHRQLLPLKTTDDCCHSPPSSGSSTTATMVIPSGMASTRVTVSAGLMALLLTPTSTRYSKILPVRCSKLGDTSLLTYRSTTDCSRKSMVKGQGLKTSTVKVQHWLYHNRKLWACIHPGCAACRALHAVLRASVSLLHAAFRDHFVT